MEKVIKNEVNELIEQLKNCVRRLSECQLGSNAQHFHYGLVFKVINDLSTMITPKVLASDSLNGFRKWMFNNSIYYNNIDAQIDNYRLWVETEYKKELKPE